MTGSLVCMSVEVTISLGLSGFLKSVNQPLFELQLPFLDQLARIERNISVAAILEILLNKTSQSQIKVIEDYTKMVLACLFY
jgi:hypothetical protein